MVYINETDKDLIVQCEKCNITLNVDKKKISKRIPSGYYIDSKVKCSCGEETTFIKRRADEILCPNCGSNQLSDNKRGFGLGKAVVGGVLLGGVGLLGGLIGSNKLEITCLKCRYKW